ncbi:MAG: HAMP domain-containing histidine kinase [Proteobacteria bacterium]|nr:HAMP domain-containing histidine kinase [Pseudomonadota bacterium]MBI3496267.1 HAMP domain-containing histidine kinase [Pseudomonadota bacterium]
MTAILGFSEAIRDQVFGPLGDPRYRDYADHVHSSGRHLLDLASELLDLSQGESGMLPLFESEVDIAALIERCAAIMAPRTEAQQLSLILRVDPGLPLLAADETRLRQILLNLLTNAVKFTLPPGEITIAAEAAMDGGIVVSVTDTGIGMKPEDIPRALEPFVRLATPLVRRTEGVGLGLPLCKRLAELHGAAFEVQSQLGKGTVCTVRFPASRSQPRAAAQSIAS